MGALRYTVSLPSQLALHSERRLRPAFTVQGQLTNWTYGGPAIYSVLVPECQWRLLSPLSQYCCSLVIETLNRSATNQSF